jgi:2-iminobutanoate/2-iminopropanoate deaminase
MGVRKVTTLRGVGGELVGQLVDVGGMLFSSGVTGIDPETGALSDQPGLQIASAFDNLARLLQQAGAGPGDVGQVTVCVPAGVPGDAIEGPWVAMFPDVGDRPARVTHVYDLPPGQLVQIQVSGVRGARRRSLQIPGQPLPGPVPAGAQMGNVVFSSLTRGVDPFTGELVADGERQVAQAFANVVTLVEQAGGTRDDVAHIFILVRNRGDNDFTLHSYVETFSNDGNLPARKNIYHDALQGTDVLTELQTIAVVGQGARENVDLPGFKKSHPNPAGAKLGNLLFTCGIAGEGRGASLEAQTTSAFGTMRQVVEAAGGSLDDVGQVSVVVADYATEPIILREWRALFPDPADQPALRVMAFGGRGADSYGVQVHMVAALN